jgi:mannose-1-phosphate guanylyltransferase
MPGRTWAIVLAAGDGTRLRAVATDAQGVCTPKQFLSFGRTRSLLGMTLDRARALAVQERIVTVVAAGHEPWWRREMESARLGTVLVQPRNAGTAAGVLLPVVFVLQEDADAVVLILPSDHHVADEATFAAALAQLVAAAWEDASKVVLLGMEPDGPEVQYGWIVPSAAPGTPARLTRAVEAFVEKPRPQEAASLLVRGALWSTFVLAASARALLGLFQRATPAMAVRFLAELAPERRLGSDSRRLRDVYDDLDDADFSAAVLQHPACRDVLRALPAAACGWTDLGTPERVARALPRAVWASAAAQSISPGLPPDGRRALPNGAQR